MLLDEDARQEAGPISATYVAVSKSAAMAMAWSS
jgi:hypothetical protein